MKTIVFAPAVFNLAETTRMLEVAKQLQYTYHCQFIGFSQTFAYLIKAAGFSYDLLRPTLTAEQEKQIMALDQGKSLKNPFTQQMVAQRVKSERASLAAYQPELIITGSNVTIFLSARIKQIPLIYIKPYAGSSAFWSDPNAPLPLFMRYFGPLKTSLWASIRHLIVNSTWKPAAFKKTAAVYGLQLPCRSLALMNGDLNLITTPALFISSKELPAQDHIVGPIFAEIDGSLPKEVTQFIACQKKRGKKIMYLAMGSSGDPQVLQKIIHYFADKKEIAIIAPIKKLMGQKTEPPSNLLICDYLPTNLLKDLIDFSLIHGGEGTIQTACASGKPFIAIGMQYEQRCHIVACVKYGHAVELTKPVTNKKLDRALQALDADAYSRAATLQQSFDVNGAANAAAMIQDVITSNEWAQATDSFRKK
ncbi:glycosyltransferase [Enterococcus sp. N342-3-1-2]